MGGDILPSSGNKFTGSKYVVAGIGLITYKNTNNTVPTIRQNGQFIAINPSPTPTPSFTPTNTPTPTITPTPTPSPLPPPPVPLQTFTFNGASVGTATLEISFDESTFYNGGYIDWGDSTTTTISSYNETTYSKTYTPSYTGEIIIYYYGSFVIFRATPISPSSSTVYVFNSSEFIQHDKLNNLNIGRGRLTGFLSDLYSLNYLEYLTVANDFTSLPLTSEVNPNLLLLSLTNTSISGDVSLLPCTGLLSLSLAGTNIVSGDIIDLPPNLTTVSISGQNILSGNVSSLLSTLTTINITGNNTISGDTIDFNLPSITSLNLGGDNTITGDLINLPNTVLNLTIQGNNSLYGNLSDIPSSVRSLTITTSTSGVITGDLSDLPNIGYSSITLQGNNFNISANMATIPLLTGATLNVTIENSLSGDISDLFNNGYDFPQCLFSINALGASSCSITYTSGVFDWGNIDATQIFIDTVTTLTSNEIDDLLIDVDSYNGGVTWVNCVGSQNVIRLYGNRTAASDAAVASLNGKGVTVTITP